MLQELNVTELQGRKVKVETRLTKYDTNDKTNTVSLPKIIVTSGKEEKKESKQSNNKKSSSGIKKTIVKLPDNKTQIALQPSTQSHKVVTKPDDVEQRAASNMNTQTSGLTVKAKSDSENNIPNINESFENSPNLSTITRVKLLFSRKKKVQSNDSVDNDSSVSDGKHLKNTDKPQPWSMLVKLKGMFKRKRHIIVDNTSQQAGSSSMVKQSEVHSNNVKNKVNFRTVGVMTLAVSPKLKQRSQSITSSQSSNSKSQSPRNNSKPKLSTFGRIAAFFKTTQENKQPGTSKRISAGDKSSDRPTDVPPAATYKKSSTNTVHVTNGNKKAWYKGLCKKPTFYKVRVYWCKTYQERSVEIYINFVNIYEFCFL